MTPRRKRGENYLVRFLTAMYQTATVNPFIGD